METEKNNFLKGIKRIKLFKLSLFYFIFLFTFTLLLEILFDNKNWEQYFYLKQILKRIVLAGLLTFIFILWYTKKAKSK